MKGNKFMNKIKLSKINQFQAIAKFKNRICWVKLINRFKSSWKWRMLFWSSKTFPLKLKNMIELKINHTTQTIPQKSRMIIQLPITTLLNLSMIISIWRYQYNHTNLPMLNQLIAIVKVITKWKKLVEDLKVYRNKKRNLNNNSQCSIILKLIKLKWLTKMSVKFRTNKQAKLDSLKWEDNSCELEILII